MRILFAAMVWVSICGVSQAAAPGRRYTVDDYLKLESIGAARTDPTGRRIVWEQAPAYDTLPDYSIGHIGTWGSLGGHLMRVDLTAAQPRAELLFTPDPQRLHWLDSFSPTGRYLAFYSSIKGRIEMGVYDSDTGKTQQFDAAPRVHWYKGHESVWVSEDEFVFAAHERGRPPVGLGVRQYSGDRIVEEWHKSWAGKEPGVSEVISRADDQGGAPIDGRLLKINARTGEMALLSDGLFEDITASADGRYLAALRQFELAQPDPKATNVDWVSARSQLVLFDLRNGGQPQALAADKDVFTGTLAWSPNKHRLAFFAWTLGAPVRSGIFNALDAKTGRITAYPHAGLDLASERERGYAQKPERVMWIDDRLAVLARNNADGNRAPQFSYREISGRGTDAAPEKADWFLLDAAGKAKNLTARFKEVSAVPLYADARSLGVLADRDAWRVSADGKAINLTPRIDGELSSTLSPEATTLHAAFKPSSTLLTRKGDQATLVIVDWLTGKTSTVQSPSKQAQLLAAAESRQAALFRNDTDAGSELQLQSAAGKPLSLALLNAHLAQVARTQFKSVEYEVDSVVGKRKLESCILLPHDYQPGKRYPVIVEVYPSTGARCPNSEPRSHMVLGAQPGPSSEHLLAAHGYIVFWPNTSRAVTRTEEGPINGMPSIVEQAIDALVSQGYADAARIGLFGFSQGGFSSLWVASQSDRFRAVVSLNGWVDMYTHYFESNLFHKFYDKEYPLVGAASRYEATAGTDFGIGKSPWDDPDAYIRNSPLFHAKTVNAPTLLVHSDMDIFTLAQYEMMFTALYRQRKDAKLLRYWGEGHGPSSPANIRHLWTNIFQWYDGHLD